MCRVRRSSICIWWATSAADCATSTKISTAPSTRGRHGLRGVSFTLLTSFLAVCDGESLNGEDLEEADLLVECLPRGDPTGPEFVHHCTEPLKRAIEAKHDLTVGRHRACECPVQSWKG